MAETKGLRSTPINITDELWYYEEKGGVCIVHEIRVKPEETGIYQDNYIRTDQIFIPWKKLLESVSRKYGVLAKPHPKRG